MERFWRTMRDQCLVHLGGQRSLHDVQLRLLAWLDTHYLVTPHASLMGKTPSQVYVSQSNEIPETMLREALVVQARRRVLHDGTLSIAGTAFELDASYLCGKMVSIGRSFLDPTEAPWVEYEDQRLALVPVDPRANAKRRRKHRAKRGIDAVSFDPNQARLDARLRGEQ